MAKKTKKTNSGKVVPTIAGKVTAIPAHASRQVGLLISACSVAGKAHGKLKSLRDKAKELWDSLKGDVKNKREQVAITLHVRAALAAAPHNLKPEEISAVCNPIGLRLRAKGAKGLKVSDDKVKAGLDFLSSVYPETGDQISYLNVLRDRLRDVKKQLAAADKERAAAEKK